jgi:hypothetical protein
VLAHEGVDLLERPGVRQQQHEHARDRIAPAT